MYVGREGQWSYMLNRLTGVGVLLFLFVHIFETFLLTYSAHDMAAVESGTSLYDQALAIYKTPYFRVAEFALVGAVLFHSLHGIRIVVSDFWPHTWKYQRTAARVQFAVFAALMLLIGVFMLGPIFGFHPAGGA